MPRPPSSRSSPHSRLVAVWFADIAGYTELASRREDEALRLVALFQELSRAVAALYGGQVVKFLGDGALGVFDSASEAVRAAMVLAQDFADRSAAAGLPAQLRVGVHLGEVHTAPDGDVYGDGVNVASRLQTEAVPGQVLVSEDVWRQLRRRSGFTLEPGGERRLKGIDEPVPVFSVTGVPAGEAAAGSRPGDRHDPATRTWTRSRILGAGLAVLVAIGLGWWIWGVDRSADSPATEATSTPALQTLAVLPFENVGADPEDEYFSDGVTLDIIAHLSEIEGLRVISRTSSMRYKDTDKTIREIAEELGATTILEGSVQRAGDRIRVTAQLVDARTDEHLWSETFDRRLEDIFAIQSELAGQIAMALEATLSPADSARLAARPTEDLRAYELYVRGRALLTRHTERDTRAAIESFESALARDSTFALAYTGLALASAEMHLRFAPREEVAAWGERAVGEARRALGLESDLAEAHEALAAVYGKTEFDWARTIEESRRALELNPNLAPPYYYMARAFYHLGLLERAEEAVRQGFEIDPAGDRVEPLRTRGVIALLGGRYGEAVTLLEEVRQLSEGRISDTYLAQAYYYAGDRPRAEGLLIELQQSTSASASTRAGATLASFLAARGEKVQARDLAQRVADGSYMDHHVAYSLGAAYAQLGDPVEAARWLREAADTGLPCYPWYALDPLLEPARGSAPVRELLENLEAGWHREQERYGA